MTSSTIVDCVVAVATRVTRTFCAVSEILQLSILAFGGLSYQLLLVFRTSSLFVKLFLVGIVMVPRMGFLGLPVLK